MQDSVHSGSATQSRLPLARSTALLARATARFAAGDPCMAMEDLAVSSFNGEVKMRKADHQLQQTLYQFTWRKKDAKNPYDVENTGMTWVLEKEFPPYVSSTPTSCQMKRP